MKLKRSLIALLLLVAAAAGVLHADAQMAGVYTNQVINNPSGTAYVGGLNLDGGNGAANGLCFGASASCTPIKLIFFIDISITPGSQATITCAPQSFTVTGVTTSDYVVLMQYPATGNGTGYGVSRVTAANTVAQTVCNPTAGALTPAAGIFTYMVVRR